MEYRILISRIVAANRARRAKPRNKTTSKCESLNGTAKMWYADCVGSVEIPAVLKKYENIKEVIQNKERSAQPTRYEKTTEGQMDRQTISTDQAPAAIGPYAQANRIGELLFTSGQIPLDPQTGEIAGQTIEAQTERALENLKAVIEAGGGVLSDVIKTTVFLKNIDDFAKMNEVYARYFSGEFLPSRSAVAVAALPKGALVEIEAIAKIDCSDN
jgi:2-iminobutanoate/2-iminopropanoate deaminase